MCDTRNRASLVEFFNTSHTYSTVAASVPASPALVVVGLGGSKDAGIRGGKTKGGGKEGGGAGADKPKKGGGGSRRALTPEHESTSVSTRERHL